VVDLAVAVVIGAAFGKIVTSFTNDIFMPPIGLLLGKVDFTNLFITLKGGHFATLDQAKSAGAVTLNYGNFIEAVVDFLIISFAVFALVRIITRLKAAPPPSPTTKSCPFCATDIPIPATRCPHCTSTFAEAASGQK